MIYVTGGVYIERCIQPRWHQLFGSGGRAAAALAARGPCVLHTYLESARVRELQARSKSFGNIDLQICNIERTLSFDYVHPLSVPVIQPSPYLIPRASSLSVQGDVVLRFGMLEGDAIVTAERAVYDPQSAADPKFFGDNGSRAKSLAVVANAYEIRLLTGIDGVEQGARAVLKREGAEVVVVKRGARGALVVTPSAVYEVPAYRTSLVFSIGSGDIFAAAFAQFWALQQLPPEQAADLASRSAALYCESQSAALLDQNALEESALTPISQHGVGRVYLAGPFFCLKERWLVEEARSHLLGMGLSVFSPLHDVGPGPAELVAPADLDALKDCDRMLALVDGADPGTLFEVGYARAKGMPVIALSETLSQEELKMLVGSGCVHTEDFATAIYLAAWG